MLSVYTILQCHDPGIPYERGLNAGVQTITVTVTDSNNLTAAAAIAVTRTTTTTNNPPKGTFYIWRSLAARERYDYLPPGHVCHDAVPHQQEAAPWWRGGGALVVRRAVAPTRGPRPRVAGCRQDRQCSAAARRG